MVNETGIGICVARELWLTLMASGLFSIPVTFAVLFLKSHTGLQTPPYSTEAALEGPYVG